MTPQKLYFMNPITSNCEHVLNFWIFYYHLQLFKQRNLINYQQRDSGSYRKKATVVFIESSKNDFTNNLW